MALRDVIDAARSADYPPGDPIENVGDALWGFLRRHGDQRDPTRASGYHPSGAHRFCARLDVLKRHFERPEADYISPGLRLTFDWGSMLHAWAQNHYFGPMGTLWGKWKAVCCGRETESDGFLPAPCSRCVSDRLQQAWHSARDADRAFGGFWTYIEPRLELPDEDIIGHCDGWLKMIPWDASSVIDMLEIKSINGNGFSRLSAPQDAHVFQSCIYMSIADEMGDHIPKPRKTHIVYFSKEAKQDRSQPKAFRASFDPEPMIEWRRRIALHRKAEADGWRLVPGICKSRVDGPARYCMFSDLCFRDDIDESVEAKIAAKGTA